MLSGNKFRAYPGRSLKRGLWPWIGHQRFIKNAKVREERYFNAFAKSALSLTGLRPKTDQAYSHFITEETAFLREVPSQILRNGAYRHAQACARAKAGLGGAPQIQKKHGRQSVMLTSELFEFSGEYCSLRSGKIKRDLYLGTKKFPLGRLPFKAHADYQLPQSICISVLPSDQWYVSFCYEKTAAEGEEPVVVRTQEELLYEFSLRTDLPSITQGLDRGISVPLASSAGEYFKIEDKNLQRIAKRERRAARYQRKLARQQPTSNRRRKTKLKIAKLKQYGAEVRQDFAHKASHKLVTSSAEVFVFEDLKLKNMTASPAPVQVSVGRWAPNGSAAKAGLNKALLKSALGTIAQFTAYKAAARNKLFIKVPCAYSSQECSECGYVDASNRPTQESFLCLKCGYLDHADTNAAKVIKARGIALIKSGKLVLKKKKTVRIRRGKDQIGRVSPESAAMPKPEDSASDGAGGLATPRSAGRSGKPPLNNHVSGR